MRYLLLLCLFLNCATLDRQQSIGNNYDMFELEVVYLHLFRIEGKYYIGYVKTDLGAIPFVIERGMTYLDEGEPRLIGIEHKETYIERDYNDYRTYYLYLPKEIIEGLK